MRRILLLVSCLTASASLAQNMPKPDLYLVHEEIAKPSSMAGYESAGRDFLSALTEKKVNSPALRWTTFTTTDMHYIYLVHLDSFAALDNSNAEWNKARETVGATRWDDLSNRGNSAVQSYNESIVMYRPDLSYNPATPRVPMAERRFYRWDIYYLIPGKEKEAEQVAKDYAALYKQKNMTDSWNLYQGLIGSDLPVFIVAIPARNETDLVTADQGVNNTLGADLRTLQARAVALTRRFERREGISRPDLSYPPPTSAAK
jgi:hypothetical protein